MKILSLMKETGKETKRKGMFTSGILSECDVGKAILFMQKHREALTRFWKCPEHRWTTICASRC